MDKSIKNRRPLNGSTLQQQNRRISVLFLGWGREGVLLFSYETIGHILKQLRPLPPQATQTFFFFSFFAMLYSRPTRRQTTASCLEFYRLRRVDFTHYTQSGVLSMSCMLDFQHISMNIYIVIDEERRSAK